MIRGIVAIDENRGMAAVGGIPWKLQKEADYFVDKIKTGQILMGYDTYVELSKPFHGGLDYVATHKSGPLRDGFVAVPDARQFLEQAKSDVWNIGGPGLLASTMDLLDEFYITQIEADFGSTKFLPDFHELFTLREQSPPIEEDGVRYRFQIWQRT